MFKYRGRTLLSIQLRLLDHAVDSDVHESVLRELGHAIRKCRERLDRTHDDDPSIDLERELIESLLGTAYVVCQAKITAVVARAAELLAKKPHEIRAMGPGFDTDFSKIEVLWALGNYFKHGDEWERSEWDAPTGLRRQTVSALTAAGLKRSPSFRTGAEALGNRSPYTDAAAFGEIVDEWAAEVRRVARSATTGSP
jgi:hypothetical protein